MNRKDLERKAIKNFWKGAAAVAVAMMFLIPGASMASNVSDTIVSIIPDAQDVEKGTSFTVDVYIEPVEPITAAQFFHLYFDETLIQADLVTEGDLFGGHATWFDEGTIDNVNGEIRDVYNLITDGTNVTDPGVFVTITFTATNTLGTSPLDLEEVKVTDVLGDPVSIVVSNGIVEVGEGSSVEWDVTLIFNEDSGKYNHVVFGEAVDANDGEPPDSYDMPKPPAPQPPYLRAWFEDDLSEPYNWLWRDYRSYPDTEKTWDLYTKWESTISNLTNVTISWDISEFTNCEYSNITLMRYDPFDEEWDFAADMLTENEYMYTPRWFNGQWLMDQFQIVATGGLWNNPPNTPSNPNPNNGKTGVDINADLSWTGGDPNHGDTVTYDVYFGTTSPPPMFISNQSPTTCDPGTLAYETQHYWQIVAWDNHGASTDGPIWSFTTKKSSDGGPGGPGGPGPGQNNPPIADANGPYTGAIGIPVTFDGSGSSDPDGDITNYTWYFGDGIEGYGEITDYIYAEAGNYTVALAVTDDGGIKRSNLTYAIITGVANNPPSMPIVTGSRMGQKNIIYNYTAVSTDLDNDTIRYFFEWDDGANTTSGFLASGIIYNTSRNWTTSGVYAITVYAEDINGGVSGTTEMTVFIDMNVRFIDDVIQGYLLDWDNDDIFDIFYNNATGNETTVELQDNGNYLIDSDGDTIWNYEYDPWTDMLIQYSGEGESTDEEETSGAPWYVPVSVVAIVIIVLAYGAKKLKERQELKKKVRREMKEKADREAKKEEADREAKEKEEKPTDEETEEKESKEKEDKSKNEEAEKKDSKEESKGNKPTDEKTKEKESKEQYADKSKDEDAEKKDSKEKSTEGKSGEDKP